MRASNATVRTLLILSLIFLPGILSLNTVNVYGKNFTTISVVASPSTLNVGGMTTVFASLFGATNTAGG